MEAKTKTKSIQFTPETKPEYYGKIKKPEPIKWQVDKRKALDDGAQWYYSHLGDIQGPWDGKVMRKWLEAGHFTPSLEIRMGSVGDFAELEMHFANINDAFCIPSELLMSLLSIGKDKFTTVLDGKETWRLGEAKQRILWEQLSPNNNVYIGEYYMGKLGNVIERLPLCGECRGIMTPTKVGSDSGLFWTYGCNCMDSDGPEEIETETETKCYRQVPKPSDLDGMVKPSPSILFELCHDHCCRVLPNGCSKTEVINTSKLQINLASALLTKKLLVHNNDHPDGAWSWKDWKTGREQAVYFFDDGTIFSERKPFGTWKTNTGVTGIAIYQQPGDWTTLYRTHLSERIEITLDNCFVGPEEIETVYMYILLEADTGLHYLQQDCAYFQKIGDEVVLADLFGNPTKSASKKIIYE
uniref:GYF domain-containing protein n=1 Tax=viral metagenome TaxID=1070528 RepID=A0A6C0F1J5_9ZZZZ